MPKAMTQEEAKRLKHEMLAEARDGRTGPITDPDEAWQIYERLYGEGGSMTRGGEPIGLEDLYSEREAGRSRAKQKKRRGFVSTILASNKEEGEVRRPSLLS